MRELWRGDRVDFDGDYYHLKGRVHLRRPRRGVPVYIAAGGRPSLGTRDGPATVHLHLRQGEGLYTEADPAVREGAMTADRDVDDIDKMIEIKISYDTDPELALENTRFWAPLSLTAGRSEASTIRWRWSAPPTNCPSSRSPSAGSSPPTRTGRSEGRGYVSTGLNHLVFPRRATTGGVSSSCWWTWHPGCAWGWAGVPPDRCQSETFLGTRKPAKATRYDPGCSELRRSGRCVAAKPDGVMNLHRDRIISLEMQLAFLPSSGWQGSCSSRNLRGHGAPASHSVDVYCIGHEPELPPRRQTGCRFGVVPTGQLQAPDTRASKELVRHHQIQPSWRRIAAP